MKKHLHYFLAFLTLLLLPIPAAHGETAGSANGSGFNIKIKDTIIVGEEAREKAPGQEEKVQLSDNISAAVKILHFEEHKDPNDKRARLEVGGTPQIGTYCLTEGDRIGTMALVPPDWGDGLDTPYTTRDGYRGCVPLTPEELKAAGLETVEEDGKTIVRTVQVTLSVEDFDTFPVVPAQAHQERAPHTLKNYNTNFWADPNPQEFTRTVAGQEVTLRAIPVSYTFTYGDGSTLGPVSYPGSQLGEDVWDQPTDTSHKYAEPGDYQFTVSTSYRGEYSVNGGPWQVIDGTVERTTDPQLVRVWRVKAGLVADDCEQNPQAWGCPGA